MSTANLISEIEARGVIFKTDKERILFNPRNAITADDLRQLRRAKAEALALIKVKQVLFGGRRLKYQDLLNTTGLEKDRLYDALGELYDLHELKTNRDGFYWLATRIN